MLSAEINYWAVLVSAVAGFAIGSVWYMPRAFGASWMALIGRTEADLKGAFSGTMFGKTFVAALIMSYILSHFIDYAGATTLGEGAVTGWWLWLGFVATTMFINNLYEQKPIKLWVINAGYQLAVLVVAGIILAVWT